MSSIVKQIQQLLVDQQMKAALTADALKQFTALQEEAQKLTGQIEQLNQKNADQATELIRLRDQTRELHAAKEAAAKAIAEAAAQTVKAERAVFEQVFHKSRGDEHRDLLHAIFRNFQVNRTITEGLIVPPGTPNQYNSCPPGGFVQDHQRTESQTTT